MIQAWFNEHGYHIEHEGGKITFVYDLTDTIQNDAAALYTMRWMVLNSALEHLGEICSADDKQDLTLHTDSRLVEELNGDIPTDNHYAKSSLAYFMKYDSMKFSRIDYRKCPTSSISSRLKLNDRQTTT